VARRVLVDGKEARRDDLEIAEQRFFSLSLDVWERARVRVPRRRVTPSL